MADQTGQRHCGRCGAYEFTFATGTTPVETIENLMQAQEAADDAHAAWHRDNDIVHIRKQINPRRIRTGNQFYKDKAKLSADENGSQALCNGQTTGSDMSWAEISRSAGNMAYVTCPDCKGEWVRLRK